MKKYLISPFVYISLLTWAIPALAVFDRNLGYHSPFLVALRGTFLVVYPRPSQSSFNDEKYPTFYGSDFSNSPTVWSGGIHFTHSDPWDTSVILWTRAAPVDGSAVKPSIPICVSYKISEASSGNVIDSGDAFTSYDVDFTVKVEATGLSPDTKYTYQFADCTNSKTVSPEGKTRTLPSPDAEPSYINGGTPLTFSVFSCAQYQNGWFNAYGVATHNISTDFYIHLGDYVRVSFKINRSMSMITRDTMATIHDYRQRIGQYRTDPHLVAAHQAGPWITVWDDHEVADNGWKAGTNVSDDSPEGCSFSPSGACFTDRKWAAVRAYHEWMPIRQVDPNDKLRIWRNFQVGKLMDLTMLDTRHYDRDVTVNIAALADVENRSMMGPIKKNVNHFRFLDTLDESVSRGAVWRVVGQQVIFTEIEILGLYNYDQWDGYRASRNRIYDPPNIQNVVVLAGDSHSNWVSDLSRPGSAGYDSNTGEGAVGVEFAVTAVSSSSHIGEDVTPEEGNILLRVFIAGSEDLQWSELTYRGFYSFTVDANYLNTTFYALRDIKSNNLNAFISANFTVKAGANRLERPVAGGHAAAGVLRSDLISAKASTDGAYAPNTWGEEATKEQD
ncbi:PhoD-like phosphatase-domain-containing protein [Flagelloscypha sp. PMI_526]|nr:PhoD-like phosphatase-domain-containing protein [Flagelloscypha sp. PMI_526]